MFEHVSCLLKLTNKKSTVTQGVFMFKSFLVLCSVFIFSAFAFAGSYNLDKSHSNVGFEVTHMVITDVAGKFTDYDVKLTFDPKNLNDFSVEAVIKINSVTTENQKRDDHLRSPDFFDAANHPDMVFKSTKLEKAKDGYVAKGMLTIRGISKAVDLQFMVKGPINDPWGNTRIGVEASTVINRQEFDVKWSNVIDGGGLVVGDDVRINIDAQFIAAK